MLAFLKNWAVCCWRSAGSLMSQNRWVASVVGTSEPSRRNAARRGALPVASASPAPIFTPASIFTKVTGSRGTPSGNTPSTLSNVSLRNGSTTFACP